MEIFEEEIPTVFIKFDDVQLRLECPNCKHKGLIGRKDISLMYYVYLGATLMKLNEKNRTIRLKAHKDNYFMFSSVLSLLDRSGIGWEIVSKKIETFENKKHPEKKEEYYVCYMKRILK